MPTKNHQSRYNKANYDHERTNATGAAYNKPAYRYIRASDEVPALHAAEETPDPMVLVKLFDPTGSWTWYIIEYDPESRTAFGLVDGFEAELGDFSMEELVELRGAMGLPIERDIHWTPRRLSEVKTNAPSYGDGAAGATA